jgi:FkbM family methyltransferase
LVQVEGRHLAAILREFGISQIEVLKMDIEGAELEVLDSPNDEFFGGIGQLTIEFMISLVIQQPKMWSPESIEL